MDADRNEGTLEDVMENEESALSAACGFEARTKWSRETEKKLIELWRQHQCLYDVSSSTFHNCGEKEKRWTDIAAALDLSVEEVKLRATTLRTQYSRLLKPKQSGHEKAAFTARQKWIVTSLEFLKKHVRRPTNTRLAKKQFRGPTDSSNNNDIESEKLALLQKLANVIHQTKTKRNPEDDCEDSFGVTVAMELKRIQNAVMRNKVKRQMITLLYDGLNWDQPTGQPVPTAATSQVWLFDSQLPAPSLRLLVPPVRLMSACMWQVVQQGNANQYGKLADFITLVTEMCPQLMNIKQMTLLILGLRARLILELVQKMQPLDSETIQDHLNSFQKTTRNNAQEEPGDEEVESSKSKFTELVQTLLRSPCEKEQFFKEVFPFQYGARFDAVLQVLLLELFSRLEEFLPVPSFSQVSSRFDLAALDPRFEHFVSDPEDLRTLLQHHKRQGMETTKCKSSMSDTILSTLAYQPTSATARGHAARMMDELQPEAAQSRGRNEESLDQKRLEQRDGCTEGNGREDDEETDDSSIEAGPLNSQMSPLASSPHSGGDVAETAGDATFQRPAFSSALQEHLAPAIEEQPSEGSVTRRAADDGADGCPHFSGSVGHLHSASASEHTSMEGGQTFRSLRLLRGHHSVRALTASKAEKTQKRRRLVGSAAEALKCDQCDESFKVQRELRRHMTRHKGEKPFACSHCGRRFASKQILKTHVYTHTGERPYACTLCGKRFTQSGIFHVHLRMHRNEKPYLCSTCGMSFCSSGALRNHSRTHTGERFHQCDVCGKRFFTPGNLADHQRCHTGERPFACSQCDKPFRLRSTLRRHMRTHTGEKPFQCLTCHKTFSQRGNLKVHLKVHSII